MLPELHYCQRSEIGYTTDGPMTATVNPGDEVRDKTIEENEGKGSGIVDGWVFNDRCIQPDQFCNAPSTSIMYTISNGFYISLCLAYKGLT